MHNLRKGVLMGMSSAIEAEIAFLEQIKGEGPGWGPGWTGSWTMSRLIKSSPDMGKHSGTEKRWGSG
jgi:hypothetical protein